MEKIEELSNPNSCINRALPGERVFVLLARDACAPLVIRDWVMKRVQQGRNDRGDRQIVEALECADVMEAQRDDIRRRLDSTSLASADFEAEVDEAIKILTPNLLTQITQDDMPEHYAPTRAVFVAMARLLLTALSQNGAMAGALVGGQAGNS